MSKKKKAKLQPPKVPVVSAELGLKLLARLETIAEHDTYETEYDGRVMVMCHSCGRLESYEHDPDCPYLGIKNLIAAAYAPLPDSAHELLKGEA